MARKANAFVARVNSPLSKLRAIELECAGKLTVAILDSSSEVTIVKEAVKESLVPDAVREPSGKIKIVSAFSDAVEANLVALSFGLRRTAFVSPPEVAQVACAITDKLTDADCPISKEDTGSCLQTRENTRNRHGARWA